MLLLGRCSLIQRQKVGHFFARQQFTYEEGLQLLHCPLGMNIGKLGTAVCPCSNTSAYSCFSTSACASALQESA
jgi:hypothetical protein